MGPKQPEPLTVGHCASIPYLSRPDVIIVDFWVLMSYGIHQVSTIQKGIWHTSKYYVVSLHACRFDSTLLKPYRRQCLFNHSSPLIKSQYYTHCMQQLKSYHREWHPILLHLKTLASAYSMQTTARHPDMIYAVLCCHRCFAAQHMQSSPAYWLPSAVKATSAFGNGQHKTATTIILVISH